MPTHEFAGLDPAEVAARCHHFPGLVFFDSARQTDGAISIVAANPEQVLRGNDWEALAQAVGERQGAPEWASGFAAGWVDYEGSFCFGFFRNASVFDHSRGEWKNTAGLHLPEPAPLAPCTDLDFQPEMNRETFCSMVRRAQEYIAAGDIYQVNLSQRFSSRWQGDPFAFYQALRRSSPAPHAAFLNLGGRAVLSSSPELFLKITGRRIRTCPIKGTRPRHPDSAADERAARELCGSAKERAELVMITDLERNDLGQVCEFGSVRVSDLLRLESYEQVFHLVSTVEGRLRADIDPVTALRFCFPGGSITGAPKKRAREIIAELEPVPRGLYTGAIGYFGFNGESQFNIAIRTVILEEGVARFHTGAGIVADSVPSAEYEETLHKAAGILLAAGTRLR